MQTRQRVPNSQVILELVCYVAFAGLMVYLVSTGRYQAYVTPKMVPYFYFTIAVMVIWALASCFRLFQPQYKTRAAHCFVLAIPIVLLLLPHASINTAELSTGYISANAFTGLPMQSSSGKTPANTSANPDLSTSSGSSDTINDEADVAEINIATPDSALDSIETNPPTDAVSPDAASATNEWSTQPDAQSNTQASPQPSLGNQIPQDNSSFDLSGLDLANKTITVTNDNFGAWLYELYDNMDKYVGFQISMTGFVFREPSVMKANEFVPARLMMSCCVADLSPCGLLCQYDKASDLKDDTWVTVVGTLHKAKMTYDGQEFDDIQVTVTKITPAEKVDGYLFPQA